MPKSLNERLANAKYYIFLLVILGAAIGVLQALIWIVKISEKPVPFEITRNYLAAKITPLLETELPEKISVPKYQNRSEKQDLKVVSTIDPGAQNRIQRLLNQYDPDYAAFVAIDAETGAILAMASHIHAASEHHGNLSLASEFPAASIFKIVTAAAAIDQGHAYSETVFHYNGRNHTLYKKNILEEPKINRWTKSVTLREAFGKSINPVFGRIGIFRLGHDKLVNYAEKFLFNKEIPSDIQIPKSQLLLDPTDTWELAESASGFTRKTSLNPIHGAMIAASIINEGKMPSPYLVDRLEAPDGNFLYNKKPTEYFEVMAPYTARQMQLLMEETITRGTSRKPFRGFEAAERQLDVGGKTGSLDGRIFSGRTDWFVGYASDHDRKIAVGVVTVHKNFWKVKSSYLARVMFEHFFAANRSQSRFENVADHREKPLRQKKKRRNL